MTERELDHYTFIALEVAIILVAALYFRSVWVRNGYQGKDNLLDLFEVKAFYLHVLGFCFASIIVWMVHRDENEREAWVVVGSITGGIFGGEIVADLKKSFKRPQKTPDENR